MENKKTRRTEQGPGIWFHLDPECNRLLEISATANGRTKKAEAAIRLKDHLRKFDTKMAFTQKQ